jgi:hypothetical protein
VTRAKQPSKVLATTAGMLLAGTVGAWIIAPAPMIAQHTEEKVNPHAATLQGFSDRLKAYVALKKKLEAGLPQPQPSDRTTNVEHHRTELAQRIKEARNGAKQGDLFGDAQPIFKQIVARDAENRGARDALATMQEVPAQSPPAVNTAYPEKAALATVPPLILVNLPRLPDGLEYRFMGRDLVLRDQASNLIIDFVPGAVPAFKK